MPPTTPFEAPTVPVAVMLLLHVPPAGVPLRVVVLLTHTASVPLIAVGSGFTVTTAVARQPVESVYDISEVPAATPVITPAASMVATAGVPLLQVPPVLTVLAVVVWFTHTVRVPVIADGSGFTVTTAVVGQPVV